MLTCNDFCQSELDSIWDSRFGKIFFSESYYEHNCSLWFTCLIRLFLNVTWGFSVGLRLQSDYKLITRSHFCAFTRSCNTVQEATRSVVYIWDSGIQYEFPGEYTVSDLHKTLNVSCWVSHAALSSWQG